jgi:hypothetical protein
MSFIRILLAAVIAGSSATAQEEGVVQERKDFIPDSEKPLPVKPGRHVMALVANGGPIIGPNLYRAGANTLVLSASGSGYRWGYFLEGPRRGSLLNSDNTVPLGVRQPYSLVDVDVEVPESAGSPDGKPPLYVKSLKVVDNSKEFALQPHKVVADLQALYAAYAKSLEKDVPPGMEKARQDAKGDPAQTKPARTATLMYVTWMEQTEKLQVRFLTRVQTTDDLLRPSPYPGRGPPPPPRQEWWGIDFGLQYEVSKAGTIEKRSKLPLESWKTGSPCGALIDWRTMEALPQK